MYVIFPADELILMTYGAAIPRINPRPTLDCLHEPKVPIYIPARSKPASNNQSIRLKSLNAHCNCNEITPVFNQISDAFVTQETNNNSLPTIPSITKLSKKRTSSNSLSSCDNLTTKNQSTPKLSVKFSNTSFPSIATATATATATAATTTKIETATTITIKPTLAAVATSVTVTPTATVPAAAVAAAAAAAAVSVAAAVATATISNTTNTFNSLSEASMYNDLNMQSQPASQSKVQRSNLERGKLISVRGNTPLHTTTANQSNQYDKCECKPSPSICLDLLPPDDPTRQKFGPGWGRPMSPMDITTEPSTSSAITKSGAKLRLKPKLHIPLTKLGRSASAEPKESHRLREDLQLHIENPIFKAENLRQRNFDVFFDAGEPVYKLQPKTPATTSSPDSTYGSIHGSTSLHKERDSTSSGLLARSQCDNKLLVNKFSETSKPNDTSFGRGRAASVSAGVIIGASAGSAGSTGSARSAAGSSGGGNGDAVVRGGSSGGGGSGSGSGTPQKDFLVKFLNGRKNHSVFEWRGLFCGSLNPYPHTIYSMTSWTGILRDYEQITLNAAFKSHKNYYFKLIINQIERSLLMVYNCNISTFPFDVHKIWQKWQNLLLINLYAVFKYWFPFSFL